MNFLQEHPSHLCCIPKQKDVPSYSGIVTQLAISPLLISLVLVHVASLSRFVLLVPAGTCAISTAYSRLIWGIMERGHNVGVTGTDGEAVLDPSVSGRLTMSIHRAIMAVKGITRCTELRYQDMSSAVTPKDDNLIY